MVAGDDDEPGHAGEAAEEAGDENRDRFLGLVVSAASHHASETGGNNFEIQIQRKDGDPYISRTSRLLRHHHRTGKT